MANTHETSEKQEPKVLGLYVVVKSLPCKRCNDNGGFATMDGWETCTTCL